MNAPIQVPGMLFYFKRGEMLFDCTFRYSRSSMSRIDENIKKISETFLKIEDGPVKIFRKKKLGQIRADGKQGGKEICSVLEEEL